ncbi:MAG: glycosyltransferase [Candidatus Eremiobacteraeota bacterium]|nr:glycosyltransferase [Candidatus Eremiobacteraeota bacterium]
MSTGASSPLRFLQVIEASLGGTRRYLEDVFGALGGGPSNGLIYSLHRADSSFIALLQKLRAAGWMLFEVDMRRSIDPVNDAKSAMAVHQIYRSFKPEVVHAHSSKAGAIARLATIGMRQRPGIVYTPNSIGVNLGWIFHPIERLLALRLDVLAAVTRSEREELRALKLVPPSRIHVVHPTIDPHVFAPHDRIEARRALCLPDGPLIVAVGRVTAQKDPLTFVDFVAELQRRVADVRAIWVGDGELRQEMTERIASLNLQDAISITGWLDDVRTHIAACDLFVSTSSYESFGYVTAEALAMDRAVVASAITGTVDVVATDVDQQLYAYRDVSAAAILAERFLTDQRGAAEVARRGRAHVLSTFSVASTRRSLEIAYEAALEHVRWRRA